MPENKEQKATPITAETKKSTEPTKAEESKSPTGQKAKTTQEVTKPTGEAKPAPATEAKKPSEAGAALDGSGDFLLSPPETVLGSTVGLLVS